MCHLLMEKVSEKITNDYMTHHIQMQMNWTNYTKT